MNFFDERLNAGILIKCLQENFVNGKNEYTINKHWWEISDTGHLNEIVDKGYLSLENKTISFTEKGKQIIRELYKETTDVAIENVYRQLKLETERILNAFQ